MKNILILLAVLFSFQANARTITLSELVGDWVPSGEMPRKPDSINYSLTIDKSLAVQYVALDGKDIKLSCKNMPSESQSMVFVFFCYLGDDHLITLALGGWVSESGYKQIYGYEYWLGYPSPGEVHGGLPVSFKIKGA